MNELFTFIESAYETDEQLNNILCDEHANSQHFDLARGLVFRCHIVYYKQISSTRFLSDKCLLVFNFHNASFDFLSMNIFLQDLNQAYTKDHLLHIDHIALNYLDCK